MTATAPITAIIDPCPRAIDSPLRGHGSTEKVCLSQLKK